MFFSEALGYWVVSRYDDIKAIFRDPITFSPAIVLEKITPPSPEAVEVLRPFRGHDEPVGVDPEADRPVGEGCEGTVAPVAPRKPEARHACHGYARS